MSETKPNRTIPPCPGCKGTKVEAPWDEIDGVPVEMCRVCLGSGEDLGAPPCRECGAMTLEEAGTKCICAGDKDDCHGCAIWADDVPMPDPIQTAVRSMAVSRKVMATLEEQTARADPQADGIVRLMGMEVHVVESQRADCWAFGDRATLQAYLAGRLSEEDLEARANGVGESARV